MSTGQATRPDWTTMRPQDFDADVPLALFDLPTPAAVASTGDDLLSLLDA